MFKLLTPLVLQPILHPEPLCQSLKQVKIHLLVHLIAAQQHLIQVVAMSILIKELRIQGEVLLLHINLQDAQGALERFFLFPLPSKLLMKMF